MGHHVQCSIFLGREKHRDDPWVQPSYVIKNLIWGFFFTVFLKMSALAQKGRDRCRVVLAARFRVNEEKDSHHRKILPPKKYVDQVPSP